MFYFDHVIKVSVRFSISLFKISKASCNSEWKSSLVEAVTRTRELDTTLRKRFKNGDVFICERHFRTEHIEFTSRLFIFSFLRLL